MGVNPVDMQIILPQSGQVNKVTRGLQFQQQIEQQVLTQQVKEDMRRQEQQVKKAGNVEGSKVENEIDKRSRSGHQEANPDNQPDREKEDGSLRGEKEIITVKDNLGNVLDIKV